MLEIAGGKTKISKKTLIFELHNLFSKRGVLQESVVSCEREFQITFEPLMAINLTFKYIFSSLEEIAESKIRQVRRLEGKS